MKAGFGLLFRIDTEQFSARLRVSEGLQPSFSYMAAAEEGGGSSLTGAVLEILPAVREFFTDLLWGGCEEAPADGLGAEAQAELLRDALWLQEQERGAERRPRWKVEPRFDHLTGVAARQRNCYFRAGVLLVGATLLPHAICHQPAQ